MREDYTPSPGLPQDLSCRRNFLVIKNDSCKLSTIHEDSDACLPPIATFSHRDQNHIGNCTSAQKPTNSNTFSFKSKKQSKNNYIHTVYYCDYPKCRRSINGEPFKQISYLKRHLLLHKNFDSLTCKYCAKRFSSKENLKRHVNLHLGKKPYVCEFCHKSFARTSERSACIKHHQHVKNMSEFTIQIGSDITSLATGTDTLSAYQVEEAIDRSRVRPYRCLVCDDYRAYTDSSSLRRHMRSMHPDYKQCPEEVKKKQLISDVCENFLVQNSGLSILNTDEPISLVVSSASANFEDSSNQKTVSTVTADLQMEIPTTSTAELSNSDMSVVLEPSDLSTRLDKNMTLYYVLWTPNSGTTHTSTNSCKLPSNVTIGSDPSCISFPFEQDDETAVDLCNSALCLQVYADKPLNAPNCTSNIEKVESGQFNNFHTDSLQTTIQSSDLEYTSSQQLAYSDMALDLTDGQYFTFSETPEIIDLSGETSMNLVSGNPIDLSASHQLAMFFESTNEKLDASPFGLHTWDPEPGFSFTDLLINSDIEFPESIYPPDSSSISMNDANSNWDTISADNNNKIKSNLLYPECINLTPFGEFFVWTAKAVEWLRREYRIFGRASYSVEQFGKLHDSVTKIHQLPVRLSFEEVTLLLFKGILQGFNRTSPVLSVEKPSNLTIEEYHKAQRQNAEEMIVISQTQRRLNLLGHYNQLLKGLKIRRQRQQKRNLPQLETGTCDSNSRSIENIDESDVSVKKRRRVRRSMKKNAIKDGCSSEIDDDVNDSYSEDLSDDLSFFSDHPLTLDELIAQQTAHSGTSNKCVNSFTKIEDALPYIPQHLPRPTPLEWRRKGEFEFIYLPETVRSQGIIQVACWLSKQLAKFGLNSHIKEENNNEDLFIKQLLRCIIYNNLWSQGYFITTSTVKMGGDLLVYQGDPLIYHGSHIVSIYHPSNPISSKELVAKLRIANSLKKVLVLATVRKFEEKHFLSQIHNLLIDSIADNIVHLDSIDSDKDLIYLSLNYSSAHGRKQIGTQHN